MSRSRGAILDQPSGAGSRFATVRPKPNDRRREQGRMKLYFSRNYNPRLAVAVRVI